MVLASMAQSRVSTVAAAGAAGAAWAGDEAAAATSPVVRRAAVPALRKRCALGWAASLLARAMCMVRRNMPPERTHRGRSATARAVCAGRCRRRTPSRSGTLRRRPPLHRRRRRCIAPSALRPWSQPVISSFRRQWTVITTSGGRPFHPPTVRRGQGGAGKSGPAPCRSDAGPGAANVPLVASLSAAYCCSV